MINNPKDILIVDDEEDIRTLIQGILEDEGYSLRSCATSAKAYEEVQRKAPDLIVLDIWLQGSSDDGLQILKNVHKENPNLPVLMISGHGTIETAVSAIKDGAYDFIEKPFKSDRLLLMIRRAIEAAELKRENTSLKQRTISSGHIAELCGASNEVEKLRQIIERAAPTNSRVLLTGEPGTGKNVVAKLIHDKSERADKPYILVNCANLRSENLESELFGKSSDQEDGLFEQANGGTLVLDEVSDLSLDTQAKIVRVLQEHKLQKQGSKDFIDVDVRILATTNKDLLKATKDGSFREDLYYRLNVVPIHMPRLRERKSDIVELSRAFFKILGINYAASSPIFDEAAFKKLKDYEWPGNIRQLKNVIEWLCIMNDLEGKTSVTIEMLPGEVSGLNIAQLEDGISGNALSFDSLREEYLELPLRDAREVFEREYILSQIDRFDGNISKTAQFIGMERSALHRKMKSLRLNESEDLADDNKVKKRA